MPVVLSALKTELTTDPVPMGYAAPRNVGNHAALAVLINTVRVGQTIQRVDVSARELVEAINVADMAAFVNPATPTNQELEFSRRYLAWFTLIPAVGTLRLLENDGTTLTPVGANLSAMFPTGTGLGTTRGRILALMTKAPTRAEQLFGANTVVTVDQVSAALALP